MYRKIYEPGKTFERADIKILEVLKEDPIIEKFRYLTMCTKCGTIREYRHSSIYNKLRNARTGCRKCNAKSRLGMKLNKAESPKDTDGVIMPDWPVPRSLR